MHFWLVTTAQRNLHSTRRAWALTAERGPAAAFSRQLPTAAGPHRGGGRGHVTAPSRPAAPQPAGARRRSPEPSRRQQAAAAARCRPSGPPREGGRRSLPFAAGERGEEPAAAAQTSSCSWAGSPRRALSSPPPRSGSLTPIAGVLTRSFSLMSRSLKRGSSAPRGPWAGPDADASTGSAPGRAGLV